MLLSLKRTCRAKRGFTMVEVLVAVIITAIIGGVLATSVVQMITVNVSNGNHMDSIKQVENALHWINRDAQMAKTITLDQNSISHFPLEISWNSWDANPVTQVIDEYHVSYRIENGNLVRRYWMNDSAEAAATSLTVAYHVDTSAADKSYCSYSDGSLTVVLTSISNGFAGASETRTLHVKRGSA
jgi:prepilin-type N-terminal cleavage/methylation domain-containing protein